MQEKKKLNKLLSILLCFMLVAGMMPAMTQRAYAETALDVNLGTNISYTFDSETGVMEVTGTGNMVGYGYCPFGTDNTEVKTLIIGEGITGVGNYCFDQFKGLTEVQFPSTLTKIGFYSFGHCESLTELTLPDSMTTVDSSAFSYCTSLSKVTIGKGLSSISGSSFCTQSMLEFDVDPENVYYSDRDGNLYNAAGTTLIKYCAGKPAEEFIVPSDVVFIKSYAFSSCEKDISALRRVVLPQDMKEIGSAAFRAASSLTEVVLPEGLENIFDSAFQYCSGLTGIEIPSTVKKIDQWAFDGTSISSIELPASVTTLSSGALGRMGKLEKIHVSDDNPVYKSVDSVLFTKDGKELLQYPQKKQGNSYVVPEGVEIIGYGACPYTSFTSVSLPSTLKRIENNAFSSSKLTEAVIPADVSYIGNTAFYNSQSLACITVMNPYVEIGDYSSLGPNATVLKSYNKCDGTPSTTETFAGTYSHEYEALGTAAHEYSAWESVYESTGETKHSRKCANCDSVETEDCTMQDLEAKAATCTEPGYTAGERCTECGYSSGGERINPLNHDYQKETVTIRESTCTIAGQKKETTTCSRCDYFDEKVVSTGMKSHKYETIPAVAPTCTEYGLTEGSKCSVCFSVIEAQTRVLPLGHDTVSHDGKAATCTEDGWEAYDTCSRCDYTTFEEIKAIGHSLTKIDATSATCTTDGNNAYFVCSDCHKAYKDAEGKTETTAEVEVIPATGHTYKDVVTRATLSSNGKIVKKCSKCSEVKSTTTIYRPTKFTLSTTAYTYDGKIKKPTVTVKNSAGKTLVKDTDYTLTYASGRKYVGKYSVKINFKGKYSGSKTLYFNINPPKTSLTSLTASSKGFTAKWSKKTTQVTGYQIQYSTSSKFTNPKTVTITKNSTTYKKITKLTAKKKYYVRVRTYKTVGTTKYYSAWSSYKSVITRS